MTPDEYRQYLHTHHWQSLRQHTLDQRGRRCESCQSTHALHVHHRNYAHLGREQPEDLRVLCENCHSLVHDSQSQLALNLAEATDLVTSLRLPIDPTEPIELIDTMTYWLAHLEVRSEIGYRQYLAESIDRHPSSKANTQ